MPLTLRYLSFVQRFKFNTSKNEEGSLQHVLLSWANARDIWCRFIALRDRSIIWRLSQRLVWGSSGLDVLRERECDNSHKVQCFVLPIRTRNVRVFHQRKLPNDEERKRNEGHLGENVFVFGPSIWERPLRPHATKVWPKSPCFHCWAQHSRTEESKKFKGGILSPFSFLSFTWSRWTVKKWRIPAKERRCEGNGCFVRKRGLRNTSRFPVGNWLFWNSTVYVFL